MTKKYKSFGEQLESIKRVGNKKDFPPNFGKLTENKVKRKVKSKISKKDYLILLVLAEDEIKEWKKFIKLLKKHYEK